MKHNHYEAKKRIILASMILVPVIPFILALGFGYYFFATSIESSTIASMKRIASDHSHMIEAFLLERKADIEFILYSNSFDEVCNSEKLTHHFSLLKKKSTAFVDLGIINAEGVHLTYCGPFALSGKNYKHEEWFLAVMQKGWYISDVFLGYRQVPHFVIAIMRQEGDKRWIIRATIDTQFFNQLVEKVQISTTGEAYIVNHMGVFQTTRRSGGRLLERDPEYLIYPGYNDEIKTFIQKDNMNTWYLYATTWFKEMKWLMIVRLQKKDAFKSLRSAIYVNMTISIFGIIMIIATAFYLTGRIIDRLKRMDAEKDELGQQLIRAGRLAELGEMAAGFAHEINNPLQIIKSEQTLIMMIFNDLKDRGELKESEDLIELEDSIHQIKQQIERCAHITQAILKFARKTDPEAQDIDLTSFISDVVNMKEKQASVNGIRITTRIDKDIPFIHGDIPQLQQVLVNLINNGMDAIIERHGSTGGEILISANKHKNGKVAIHIKDDGSGISQENIKKIFTPFFTTKPVGKGTGLGLSVCYGIVDKMKGELIVTSEKDNGTTFTITLPASE
ncbi:MAG: ATP-binding protein [Desulfobacterales bacterium]|nr:ATP-binding protein [Desulfobacterales bacterium]